MRLGGSDGWVELRLVDYQFPHLEPGVEPLDPASWDSNWLVISGSVRTAGGASWSFCHSALTTWEGGELVKWLRQVGDGAVPAATPLESAEATAGEEPADVVDRLTSAGWLTFTEPNLSFAVDGYAEAQVELLIGLSHESARPPIDPLEPERCEVAVMTNRQEVQTAAAELQEQLATHPVRRTILS